MKRITWKSRITALSLAGMMTLSACSTPAPEQTSPEPSEPTQSETVRYTVEEKTDGTTAFNLVTNPNGGAALTYSKDGGVSLLEEEVDGAVYAFKDMNKNGTLEAWEDWRLDYETRAANLSEELTKEQIAGLMLFSSHVFTLEPGMTEDQMNYLQNDELRNVLNAAGSNVEQAVVWTNQLQAYVESISEEGKAIIPVNISSDPRSAASADSLKDSASISLWPSNLGFAATFDPELVETFADIAAQEYRAMGITTALGPQVDVATEPRWLRVSGTFGEDAALAGDMTRAYADGSQSTFVSGEDTGWGAESIAVMTKHFPGDGSGEAGRESHTFTGKYAIFPGNNFDGEVSVFVDSALNLNGKTDESASFMTDYSVLLNADGQPLFQDRVATAYNKDLIDILRVDHNYEGVLCTDWGVTGDYVSGQYMSLSGFGMSYGVEDLSIAERHYLIIQAGMDMFGGNNDKQPILDAYDMWQADFEAGKHEISAQERFAQSGYRIAKMIMQTGIFESSFLDMDASKSVVASADKVAAGYQAQLDSIVLLKNNENTIHAANVESDYKDMVVYIPKSIHFDSMFHSPFGPSADSYAPTMNLEVAKLYFKDVVTDTDVLDAEGKVIGFEAPDLSEVDLVLVGMQSPNNGSAFSSAGFQPDEGWYPLSLQYRPYTADGEHVRKVSISGDILADGTQENRSYYGATSMISNEYDLDAVLNAVAAVEASGKDIPVIVALKADNAVIVSEFEAQVDAILVGFDVSDQALIEMALGAQDFNGLLPVQFPADMDTVEAQFEDVGRDMTPYTDSNGNTYDFAYGLSFNGVISDARTAKYAG